MARTSTSHSDEAPATHALRARLRARLAAYMLHARRDPRETTQAARRAFNQRFLDQVDPDRRLPDSERRRRAAAARRAYFTRLAYLSARGRRARRRT